jgi:general secretion pathway protein K
MVTRHLSDRRGVALIITLFIVALVTILVLEYHFDASVEIDLAANYGADVQAYHLAVSGINFARALLQRDNPQVDGPDDQWYKLGLFPVCFPPQQLLALAEEAEGEAASLLSPDSSQETSDTTDDDAGCVVLRIIDEQSKLPINALLPDGSSQEPNSTWYTIFLEFFTSFEIDEEALNALVDWIDPDDEPRDIGGAENEYYEGLESPYKTSNRPLRVPGELRLVRGFDYDTLAKLFPGHTPEDMGDIDLGTNTYLTVFGTAKVNLNTANEVVLQTLLGGLQGDSGSTAALVDEIITRRGEGQLERIDEDLIPDSQLRTQLARVADVKSTHFRVESVGVVGIVQKKAVAVLERTDQGNIGLVYFKVE